LFVKEQGYKINTNYFYGKSIIFVQSLPQNIQYLLTGAG